MSDRKLAKNEGKLLNYLREKLIKLASGNLGIEKERVRTELGKGKYSMICEALGEAMSRYER